MNKRIAPGKPAVAMPSEENFESLPRSADQADHQPHSLAAHLLAIPKHQGEQEDADTGADMQPREPGL